jgi:hypothetical protein
MTREEVIPQGTGMSQYVSIPSLTRKKKEDML